MRSIGGATCWPYPPADCFERFDNAGGMGAIGVAVGIEVGDREPEEVGPNDERSNERDELVPVEPERLRVADGWQHACVEYVEIEMQPRRALREPGGPRRSPLGRRRARVSRAL